MNSEQLAWLIRRHGVEMTHISHGSHIGAILSVADIVAVLYNDIANISPENLKNENRDRIILSKGHAGAAIYALDVAPDGTPALKIDGFKTVTSFPTEEFYSYPTRAFVCNNIVSAEPLTEADLGRKFKIGIRVFDTVSRYIRVELSHCTNIETSVADYRRNCYNIKTKAGEWIDVSFDYTSYEAMYDSCKIHDKKLLVSTYAHGNEKKPIYFADIKAEESTTDIEISDIMLISSARSELLPDGQSDIYCKQAPWVKK